MTRVLNFQPCDRKGGSLPSFLRFAIARAIVPAFLIVIVAAATAPLTLAAAQQPADSYVIGPSDVIVIAVFDQPSLGGKYVVEADGSFTFPHLGPIKAAGLTPRALEDALRKRLGETLFRNPQVTVGVETYRSQRFFIMGEVKLAGRHPLTGATTVIEAIAAAGGVTAAASGDVLIVRPRDGATGQPLLPGEDQDAQVLEVQLQTLQAGDLSKNHLLRDGDTVYVPRAETAYISGAVRTPGAYPVPRGLTVLQALSLAGGQTETSAINRIRIIRVEGGKRVEIRVKNPVTEVVKPGDTIIVPERWF
jgi:polysaccharide biosynthesis/export protein